MYLALVAGITIAWFLSTENPTFVICYSIFHGTSMITYAITLIHQTDKKDQIDESDENH